VWSTLAGEQYSVDSGSVINISGGTIGDGLSASNGSEVSLFGSSFAIDGIPLDSLTMDETFTVADRDVILSGILVDGSPFSFELNSNFAFAQFFFSPSATVSVTLVSNPNIILGDVDQNGVVDFADIAPFIEVLATGIFLAEADVNQDGIVNFGDISAFIEILTNA